MNADSGILAPYRVLDLTLRDGHLCGKILAQLGADVVKVEPPAGDPARHLRPFVDGMPGVERSIPWLAYNASKRGITLNLESPEGRDVLESLVRGADFVIESFKPGYLDRLGLAYERLREVKRSIVMVSLTPFGQTGPYREWEASDLTLMAMSGFLALNERLDQPMVRVGEDQAYHHAAAYGAAAALAAHYQRAQTGHGQYVDVSVLECLALMQTALLVLADETQADNPVAAEVTEGVHWRTIWRAKDGHVVWRLFTGHVLGRGSRKIIDWAEEDGQRTGLKGFDFETVDSRDVTRSQMDGWNKVFAEFFARHTKNELVEGAVRRRMMLYAAHTMGDLLGHPHLQARSFFNEIDYPELKRSVPHPGGPWLVNGVRPGDRERAPLLGQHNRDLYVTELGMSEAEMERLKDRGAI